MTIEMPMLPDRIPVRDLSRSVGDVDRFSRVPVGDLTLDGRILTIRSEGNRQLFLDDESLDRVGGLFDIPSGYLPKLPAPLIQANLQYWFSRHEDSNIILETSVDGRVLNAFPDKDLIPRRRVFEVVERVMPEDSMVHRLNLFNGSCEIDVATSSLSVEPRVGDITEGGLRFVSYVAPRGTNKHPRVSVYMHRLACTNGMTHTTEIGNVYLRGNTVDDIIEEMETVARRLLSDVVPERLEQFATLDHVRVPNPAQFVHRVARQHRITNSLEVRMMERLPELGENPTMYDLVNFMNSFQHEDGVRRVQILRLQELAGVVAAEQGAHRCPQCQTLLD